jgi:hypothetical protein
MHALLETIVLTSSPSSKEVARVSDPTTPAEADPDAGGDDAADAEERDVIPDESTLLGASGVETEVLAELARAEGQMNDPSVPDDPDGDGAQV